MSELQLDDPEPDPSPRFYAENYQTGEAYDDYDLSAYLLEQEVLSRDEREEIVLLSNDASKVLDVYGEGENTRRYAMVERARLDRVVLNGAWIFTLEDTLGGRTRCRSWRLGGDGVSWCDDEWRYEEASAVHARLMELFPLEKTGDDQPAELANRFEKIQRSALRLKRELARAIFR